MSDQTIVDCEHFSLLYHEDTKIVHHQFHQYVFGEKFRECLLKGLELMEQKKATKWLSDDRNNAALSKEDFEWSTTVWRPRAIEAGWRHWALVLPASVTGQMSLKTILDQFYGDGPVTYSLFNDPDAAMTWLKSR